MREYATRLATAVLWVTAAACRTDQAPEGAPPSGASTGGRSRIALSQALPRLDGSRVRVTVVEVTYGPGESSLPHRHPCPVIGYIVQGAIRSQVKGEAEAVHRAGETFYEAPDAIHQVSGNAGREEPARFLAYFVCDRNEPLSAPVADTSSSRGR